MSAFVTRRPNMSNAVPPGPEIVLRVHDHPLAARIFHKSDERTPYITTAEGRIFYSANYDGFFRRKTQQIVIVDTFLDSVDSITLPTGVCLNNSSIQIDTFTFLTHFETEVIKIRFDFGRRNAAIVDKRKFNSPTTLSKVENGFAIAEKLPAAAKVYIFDANESLSSPKSVVSITVPDGECIRDIHIWDGRIYYLCWNDRHRVDLTTIHSVDINGKDPVKLLTSDLPNFFFGNTSNDYEYLSIQRVWWFQTRLFVRLLELSNGIPFYHIMELNFDFLQWRLYVNPNIERRSCVVIVNDPALFVYVELGYSFRPTHYYRIPLLEPEPLQLLAYFAAKLEYPDLVHMNEEDRRRIGLPLMYAPVFEERCRRSLRLRRSKCSIS